MRLQKGVTQDPREGQWHKQGPLQWQSERMACPLTHTTSSHPNVSPYTCPPTTFFSSISTTLHILTKQNYGHEFFIHEPKSTNMVQGSTTFH